MKKYKIFPVLKIMILVTCILAGASAFAQGSKDNKVIADSKTAKDEFIHTD